MHGRLSEEKRAKIRAAWPDVVARIGGGELVREVLAANNILEWEKQVFLATEPGAREEWDYAREASADAFMDEAVATAYSKPADTTAATHARTKIDTLKWAARIRNPRLYSDKSTIDVNVKTVDLTKIIQDANARLASARQPQVIDGTAERVLDAPLQAIAHLL